MSPDPAATFERLLPKALTTTRDDEYESFHRFLLGLREASALEGCLAKYLALYPQYNAPASRTRSDQVFEILLEQRIKVATRKDDFAARVGARLGGKPAGGDLLRARFDALPTDGRNSIMVVLNSKLAELNRTTTVLSLLDDAYEAKNGHGPATMAARYDFDPSPDPAFRSSFVRAAEACHKAWSACWANPSEDTLKAVTASFSEYVRLVDPARTDVLKIFQIVRWTRLPLEIKGTSYIEYELYIQGVTSLLRYGASVKYYEQNLHGFTPIEDRFFLDPLRKETNVLRSTHVNRFKLALDDVPRFGELSTLYLELVLLGRRFKADLASDDDALRVAEKMTALSADELVARTFRIDQSYAVADFVRGTYGLGRGVGETLSIVYFDTNPHSLCVEFDEIKGILYFVPMSTFIDLVEAEPRKLVFKATAPLLILIPKLFDVIGYTFDLVDLGFIGMLKQIVVGRLIEEGGELAAQGLGGTGGLGGAADLITLLSGVLSRRRSGTLSAGDLTRKIGHLANREQRALAGATTDAERGIVSTGATAEARATDLADFDRQFAKLEAGELEREGPMVSVGRRGAAGDVPDLPGVEGAGQRVPLELLKKTQNVLNRKITGAPDAVQKCWRDAVEAAKRSGGELSKDNFRELYRDAQRKFWKNVRKPDSGAMGWFTDNGFRFEGESGAPVVDIARGAGGGARKEFAIELDHILPKATGENWTRALDADKLRFITGWDNWLLDQIARTRPELAP